MAMRQRLRCVSIAQGWRVPDDFLPTVTRTEGSLGVLSRNRRTAPLSHHRTALTTLLVTPPGATAEALRTVLQSIPDVEIIESVTGCLSAAQAIRSLAPALVVVSGQIPAEEILALIEHPWRERQAPRILILATSHAFEQRFLDAGAFAVVTPWDSVTSLRAVIGRELARQAAGDATGRRPAATPHAQRAASPGKPAAGPSHVQPAERSWEAPQV